MGEGSAIKGEENTGNGGPRNKARRKAEVVAMQKEETAQTKRQKVQQKEHQKAKPQEAHKVQQVLKKGPGGGS